MFRNFSFDPVSPPAYSEYEAERAAMNVSPTSQAIDSLHFSRPSTPPCTIGDLAVQLNQQTLRIDSRATSDTLTSSIDDCSCPLGPLQQARPTYSRVAASLLRMQRQTNSRMQCSASHARDISQLVRMIEDEEQCIVNSETRTSTSSQSSTSTSSSKSSLMDDDEALDMEYDPSTPSIQSLVGLQPWRASDRRDSCIRVTKTVRMRKRAGPSGVSKKRSS